MPESAVVHIVRSGETLTGIAAKYGISRNELAKANNITDVNRIFDRQHLKIPAGASAADTAPAAKTPVPSAPSVLSWAPSVPAKSSNMARSDNLVNPTAPPRRSGVAASAATVTVDQQRTDKKRPVTVLSSPTLEPSGRAWCSRFPGSKNLDSLNDDFKPKAKAFIGTLRAAAITVVINAAFRPPERSHLMYYAFEICKGMDVTKIPIYAGVNIDWAHRNVHGTPDIVAAKRAAAEMCAGYSINPQSASQKVRKAGRSRHNHGAAIDINIGEYIGKTVKDPQGSDIRLVSFKELRALGKSYGVSYYPRENMHWSDTGT